MQIIYVKHYDTAVQNTLSTNLTGHSYSVRKIHYPYPVYSIEIQPNVPGSVLELLHRVLHEYSVDEQRVRDWLGY